MSLASHEFDARDKRLEIGAILGWPVTDSAPMVRPWNELLRAIISYFSG